MFNPFAVDFYIDFVIILELDWFDHIRVSDTGLLKPTTWLLATSVPIAHMKSNVLVTYMCTQFIANCLSFNGKPSSDENPRNIILALPLSSCILNQQTMDFICKILSVSSILVAKLPFLYAGKFLIGPSRTNPALYLLSLPWRHNGYDSVSYHQPHNCLLNRSCGCRSKETSKLRVTGLCAGNSPGIGEFPAQMASNAENVSIWWRHHAMQMHQYKNKVVYCINGTVPYSNVFYA